MRWVGIPLGPWRVVSTLEVIMAAPKAPASLGDAGKSLWLSIASKYELRADELATLEDACLITEMIVALESAWAEDGRPMTTKGSMGQQVIHPLIGEIRAQRMSRNALWRQLKLPDGESGEAEVNQHRDAAATKWSKRGA